MVPTYSYPEMSTPDFGSIMVPIVDNVRINYLIHCIARQERAVLLIGEQGSAKTVMMKSYMKSANPEVYLNRSFNFSSATSPYQFQVSKDYVAQVIRPFCFSTNFLRPLPSSRKQSRATWRSAWAALSARRAARR